MAVPRPLTTWSCCIPIATDRFIVRDWWWTRLRPARGARKGLSCMRGKLACTVLRGGSGGNAALLPDPPEARMAVSTVHHFVVEPLGGVGPIRFGMHKDEVSRAFTYVYTSFFKVEWNKVRSDHCEVVGLIIHYNDASRVNYIEVHKARYATVRLEL